MGKFIHNFKHLKKEYNGWKHFEWRLISENHAKNVKNLSREALCLFSIVLSCLSVYQSLKLYKQFSAAWKVGQEPLHANY